MNETPYVFDPNDTRTLVCTKCKSEKFLHRFYTCVSKYAKFGRTSQCIDCYKHSAIVRYNKTKTQTVMGQTFKRTIKSKRRIKPKSGQVIQVKYQDFTTNKVVSESITC